MPVDPLLEVIALVTNALDRQGVVYAVTGSVASGIYGEPVTSIDVDIAVRMTPDQAAEVAQRLRPRFYADADMLRQAARDCSLANLIDQQTTLKVDISVLENTPYHEEVLKRRTRISYPGSDTSFWVVSKEDIILMKLLWRRDSRSRKQWENALGVVQVQGHRLDWPYLRCWAQRLGVEEDLDQLAREAGI